MSSLNLKDHLHSFDPGTETTGITGSPWRIGDATPNIHQPWHPFPSDIKEREWIREMTNVPSVVTPASLAERIIVDPPTSRNRTIKFKEVVFTAYLSDEVMEFFEDDRHVTRDELRLLEVAHPKEYAKIKQAWITAWKELQALNAFEND